MLEGHLHQSARQWTDLYGLGEEFQQLIDQSEMSFLLEKDSPDYSHAFMVSDSSSRHYTRISRIYLLLEIQVDTHGCDGLFIYFKYCVKSSTLPTLCYEFTPMLFKPVL